MAAQPDPKLQQERTTLAMTLDRWLEWPMVALAAVWLVLLVIELIQGLSPALERFGVIIWAIFIGEFVLRFTVAGDKSHFLRRNWLTLLTLVLPAIRVLRVFRIARAVRGVRLVRILGSVNRGMNSLGRSMQRRGLPYVAALTIIVLLAGSAGIYAFEKDATPRMLDSYGDALWWTTMLLTTIGTDYWPRSAEGRLLTLFLSLYALAILGYVAGSLAAFFIGREVEDDRAAQAPAAELAALRTEIALLREQLQRPLE
jgi:voltage-gated potassium channel